MTTASERLTPADLMLFEERVRDAFLAKQIPSPVHLSGGGERQLLRIFRGIRDSDWVLSTWRNHHHALLKGIPHEELFTKILHGESMYISSKEHKFLSSSIVGGILPIACGLALAIKRRQLDEQVWVFIGDMARRTGICHEFLQFVLGHSLPVHVVVEDNGLSTNTPTAEVWGTDWEHYNDDYGYTGAKVPASLFQGYRYKRTYPHVGVGEWVNFG